MEHPGGIAWEKSKKKRGSKSFLGPALKSGVNEMMN